ncbi:MAG TPA: hypothetical protein V6C69_04030 [Trichormus sp.]|jgi:hypothetical protein
MSDTRSAGYDYYPEAFGTGMYELGSKIANDDRFYRSYVKFLLKTLLDPEQLVHGRAELVMEVQKLAPHEPVVNATWCAISLATDRYFKEKAADFAWSDAEFEQARAQWLALLAQAFVPTKTRRRIEGFVMLDWRRNLLVLQKRDMGPLAACDMCTQKCVFGYDVTALDDGWRMRFDTARQHDNPASAVAKLALNLSGNLLGHPDADLAFCIAANAVKHQDTVEDTQIEFMAAVRAIIVAETPETKNVSTFSKAPRAPAAIGHMPTSEQKKEASGSVSLTHSDTGGLKREQVFEVIVRVALGGSAWRQICADSMQANQITEEEVENEVKRRRKVSDEN